MPLVKVEVAVEEVMFKVEASRAVKVEVPVPETVRVLDTLKEEGLMEPDTEISSGISASLRLN